MLESRSVHMKRVSLNGASLKWNETISEAEISDEDCVTVSITEANTDTRKDIKGTQVIESFLTGGRAASSASNFYTLVKISNETMKVKVGDPSFDILQQVCENALVSYLTLILNRDKV